jgi:hypothetical protein
MLALPSFHVLEHTEHERAAAFAALGWLALSQALSG